MKVLKQAIIVSLLILSSSLFAALDSSFSMSVSIVPKATYFVHDFLDAIENDNNSALGEMVSLTIVNNSTTNAELKVRLQLTTGKLGLIADATTVAFDGGFPIDIAAGERKVISNLSFDLENTGQVFSRLDKSSIINRLKDVYGDSNASKPKILPGDTYSYTLYLFHKSDSDTIGNHIAVASDTIVQPEEAGNDFRVREPNQVELPLARLNPTFQWTNLKVRDGINIKYVLKVYQAPKGQEGADQEVIRDINNLIHTEDIVNATQAQYPLSALTPLAPDTTYFWIVEAFDDVGDHIGESGLTDIGKFWVESVPKPEFTLLVDGSITNLPTFLWKSITSADKYRLYLSENDRFFNANIVEVDGLLTSHTIKDASLIEPQKTYFYYLQAFDAEDNQWGPASDIGSFMLNQEVDLSRPDKEQIQFLPYTFLWSGISGADSYDVRISAFEDMRNATLFSKISLNQFTLNEDDMTLQNNQTYYWQVQAKNELGSNWGAPSAIKSFTPNLPVKEESQDDTVVIFTPAPVVPNVTPVVPSTTLPKTIDPVENVAPIEKAVEESSSPSRTVEEPSLITEETPSVAPTVEPEKIAEQLEQSEEDVATPSPTIEPEIDATPATSKEITVFSTYISEQIGKELNIDMKDWVLKAISIEGKNGIPAAELSDIMNGDIDANITLEKE